MNIGLLLRSVHQAINIVAPRILSIESVQNVMARRIHHICNRQKLSYLPSNFSCHNTSLFLQPNLPMYNSICGIKIKGRLHLRCKDCYYFAKEGRLYVMCKTHPRHKQTQMMKKEYKTWILTWASQSKIRGW